MHSPSLQTTATTTTRPRRQRSKPQIAQTALAERLPEHLNFSFRDWLRQRTELPRLPQGWTPGTKLYADYAEWCAASEVPAEYVIGESDFAGRLRAHDDRQPEMRKISNGVRISYALCFPRKLLPAIRV